MKFDKKAAREEAIKDRRRVFDAISREYPEKPSRDPLINIWNTLSMEQMDLIFPYLVSESGNINHGDFSPEQDPKDTSATSRLFYRKLSSCPPISQDRYPEVISIFAHIILELIKQTNVEKEAPVKRYRQFILLLDILKVMPEVEHIFFAIKSVGFTWRPGAADWKEAALNEYDNYQGLFKIVTREMLDDDDLYQFSGGQEKRDFMTGLIHKIMQSTVSKRQIRKIVQLL